MQKTIFYFINREWYGWHFPELSKIITDNLIYAKVVKHIGLRTNTQHCNDLSVFVPEYIEKELRQAAEISMGIDITDEDITNIFELCDRVIELSEYR
jgi:nucleolar protein 58